jgi:Domain of unknown function (DUF5655)
VLANLWHSCGVHALGSHFEGKEPRVAAAFESIVGAAKEHGPLEVYAQKTRIVLQNRVRFASVLTRKQHLLLGLWLTHRVEHPLVTRYEPIGNAGHYPYFAIREAAEIDDALRGLIGEAYAHGASR